MHPKKMNSLMIEGFVFLLAGIGLLCYSIVANQDIMQQYWSISPYMLPSIIAVLMMAMSIGLVFQGVAEQRKATTVGDGEKKSEINWKGVAGSLVLMVVYYVLLPIIHFLPATILFLFAFLWFLGERKRLLLVLIPVITSSLLYLLFGIALSLILP